jgi:hypothetical protein
MNSRSTQARAANDIQLLPPLHRAAPGNRCCGISSDDQEEKSDD